MENLVEVTTCTLCLSSVTRGNSDIIDKPARDIVGILLPKWDFDDGKHLICNDCSIKMGAAFDFKVTCINTEDRIFPYLNSEKGGLLDLREIYLKENDCKLSISEIRNVCRLCMQLIFGEFICLEQLDINMLNTFIPEINFSSTKNPVICEACYEAFNSHSVFLTICLENEKPIKYVNDGISGLKTEEVNVRTEEVYIKTEEVDVKTEEIYLKLEENENCDLEEAVQVFEYDEFSSKTWNKSHLHSHVLAHIDMYKCNECSYKTKKKSNLIRHVLVHKDPSEVQIYKCEECSHKTKHKKDLRNHMLVHRDASVVQMFKCDECSFKTKYKRSLRTHKLGHRDPSEVQMYKCDECSFTTRRKSDLFRHQLLHKDASEIQMYKCDECNFTTRRKSDLFRHQLLHKDASELQMYQCDQCSYKTRHKRDLHSHQLRHRDLSEIQMYKCVKCSRQYKYRTGLRYHRLKGCVDRRVKHDGSTCTLSMDIG